MYLFCKGKNNKKKASTAGFSEEAITIKKDTSMRKSTQEASISNLFRIQMYSAGCEPS